MSDSSAPPSSRWTDAVLDAARRRGDAAADAAVAELFASGGPDAVGRAMASLVTNSQMVPERLPAPLRLFLERTAIEDPRSAATIAAGERVFATHGPEILLVLCCSSLPSAYAAGRGVQVLYRTSYLAKRPTRRLFETAQMIIDVMSPGGLGPNGKGLRTAQKVRLMHAAIRHLIQHDPGRPWPLDAYGVPINQEDLLGTLMTFSWLIVDGLATLGAVVSPADAEAYTATWLHVGRHMGIDPALLPATVAETRGLTATIERRQVAPSPEGREMTAALLGMMQENLPHPFSHIPAGLLREFLPPAVADGLGVPHYPLTETLITVADHVLRPVERLTDAELGRHMLLRAFAIKLLQWMESVELGDNRASFTVPDSLAQGWEMAPAASEESFWQKLRHWDLGRNASS